MKGGYEMEYLDCPICGVKNNEIKPCARRNENQPLSYTFRCPGCGIRAFLPEETYDRLTEAEKILTD
jgi:DNA-directed RNA polymerase subunit RPC12/RpoP